MEKFSLHNKERYNSAISYLQELRDAEKFNQVIEIKRKVKARSLSQNRLYHMYKACIHKETGNDLNILHEFFISEFCPKYEFNGSMLSKRTKELDSSEFKILIDRLVFWASSELGIALPDPSDLEFARFEDYYKNYI